MSPLPNERRIAPEVAPICHWCPRRLSYFVSNHAVNGIVPAAEFSDTDNRWQCANRLPMEG